MRARRSRAAAAISGSLGLFALGLAGPLGVGSARDGSGASPPRRVVLTTPQATIDPTLGACPSGSSPIGVLDRAAGLRVCQLEVAVADVCVEPARDALYVAPGSEGDGTRERPFGTLDAALARAPRGATIVLRPGAHDAPSRPIAGVSVRAACDGGARLVGPTRLGEGGALTSIDIDGTVAFEGHAVLRDLSVRGEPALRLEGPHARGALERVQLHAEREAVVLRLGARLEAELVRVEGGGLAIRAEGQATRAELTHLEVAPGPRVRSLDVRDRARVLVRGSFLAGGIEDAAVVEGAELALEETVLHGPSRALLDLREGSHARLSHVALEEAREHALVATEAVLEARGLVVRAHRGVSGAAREAAILAHEGSQVVLEDAVIHAAHSHALLVSGRGTYLRGERLELFATRAAACATTTLGCAGAPRGHGIAVTEGARVEVHGSHVAASEGCALFVDGPFSRVALDSSLVRDNRVALCGDGASGDWMSLARDVRLEDNESVIARPRATR